MSFLSGMDDRIDEWLGLEEGSIGRAPQYQHKATLQQLEQQGECQLDGLRLIQGLWDQANENWEKSEQKMPSQENWRWEPRRGMASKNRSPEVTLERTIVQVLEDDNWTNQIPSSSGLTESKAHHIDLGYRNGKEVSFIELKWDSNTPVYAAFEILKYSISYLFSRENKDLLGYSDNELLTAPESIHLIALAPLKFYELDRFPQRKSYLKSLETVLSSGLQEFTRDRDFSMDFAFEAFPDDFDWKEFVEQFQTMRHSLTNALDHRLTFD